MKKNVKEQRYKDKQRVEFSPSLTQFMVNEIKLHSTSYVEEFGKKEKGEEKDVIVIDGDVIVIDGDVSEESKPDTETKTTEKSKPSAVTTSSSSSSSTTTTTTTTTTSKPIKFQRMAIPIVNRLRTILTATQKSSLLLPIQCIKPAPLTPKENTFAPERYRNPTTKNVGLSSYENSILVAENKKLFGMAKEMDSGLRVLEKARDLEVRNSSRAKEEKRGEREEIKDAVFKVVKDLTEGLVVGGKSSSSSSSSSSSTSTANQHHHLITSSLNSLTSLTKPTTTNSKKSYNSYEHMASVKRESVTFPTSYNNLDGEYKKGGKGGVMNVVLRGMAEVFEEL